MLTRLRWPPESLLMRVLRITSVFSPTVSSAFVIRSALSARDTPPGSRRRAA